MINKSNRYLLGERFVFSPSDSSLIDLHENDELIRLGSNECRVLMVLIEEPHAIVTRNRIHDFVWRKQGFEVDDSSLTQSISTLRKALKDSTKIPLFVKTVPKRGYQVICSVERYNDQPVEIPTSDATATETIADDKSAADIAPVKADTDPSVSNDPLAVTPEPDTQSSSAFHATTQTVAKKKLSLRAWFALIVAVLIPAILYVASTPKSEAFRQILVVENTPVSIPVSNARIEQWKPMLQRCVQKYIEFYGPERELKEVIVTGGQDNKISLNYVHSAKFADYNRTYVLLTSHEESDTLCR